MMDLLKENKKEEFEEACRRDEFFNIMDNMKRIEDFLADEGKKMGISEGYDSKFEYSGLKAFEVDSEETAYKIFKNVEIPVQHLPQYYPHYISLVNSSFKFRHTTIIHEKFLKFIPTKDCEILIC